MAGGTRRGEAFLRSGEKPRLPPSLPIRRQHQAIVPANGLQISSAIAVVATLDIETVYMERLGGTLPPRVESAFAALGPPEWVSICSGAIREQNRLLTATDSTHLGLRRDEPLLLAEFLPTMSP